MSLEKIINEKYFGELKDQILHHWDALYVADGMEKNDFYEKYTLPTGKYWYGDLAYRISSLEKQMGWKNFKQFPKSIVSKDILLKRLAEFHYLYPQTECAAAFLPLPMTNFFLNWSLDQFVSRLYLPEKALSGDFVKEVRMFQEIPPVYTTYSKLFSNPGSGFISSKNAQRALAMYRRIIVFFLIMQATRNRANIPLSFYTFAAMTGYFQYLGNEVEQILCKIEDTGLDHILKKTTESAKITEEICAYIDNSMSEFGEYDQQDCIYHSKSLCIFIGNLRQELYADREDAIPEDESDMIARLDDWKGRVIQGEDLYTRINSDYPGLFSDMLEKHEDAPG